jgi:pilus assembly protein CpaF
MVNMSGVQFPVHVIRDQMASTLDLVLQLGRMTGGRRKIVSIAEITGMEHEVVLMQDIFRFVQTGIDADGHAKGQFQASGVRPTVMHRFESEGVELDPELFRKRAV